MIMQGDMVAASGSHQATLQQLMSEHIVQYGLKVKTLQTDNELLPSKCCHFLPGSTERDFSLLSEMKPTTFGNPTATTDCRYFYR